MTHFLWELQHWLKKFKKDLQVFDGKIVAQNERYEINPKIERDIHNQTTRVYTSQPPITSCVSIWITTSRENCYFWQKIELYLTFYWVSSLCRSPPKSSLMSYLLLLVKIDLKWTDKIMRPVFKGRGCFFDLTKYGIIADKKFVYKNFIRAVVDSLIKRLSIPWKATHKPYSWCILFKILLSGTLNLQTNPKDERVGTVIFFSNL